MSERPRLLVLTSTYPRRTGETEPEFVHELAKRLTAAYSVTVLAPHVRGSATSDEYDGVRVKRFRYAPERLEQLAYQGGILTKLKKRPWTALLVPFFLTAMLLHCVRELRRHRYAIIHAHWLVPQGLVAVAAKFLCRQPVKVLCTSHGGDLFGLQGSLATLLKKIVLRHSSAITVVSRAMRSAVNVLEPRSAPVDVIPMGVDLAQRFTPADSLREKNLILFVGRLVEKKGVPDLLRALAILKNRISDCRLRIVGEGPDAYALVRAASVLDVADRVEFVGGLPQHELPEQLRQAALFVMPSIRTRDGDQEGLGLVQIEAMGCGCPVIASDLPAVRDVISSGVTGILTPPGDSAALASAIENLLVDETLRKVLADNALKYVRERFDWDIVAERYARKLDSLLDQRTDITSANTDR